MTTTTTETKTTRTTVLVKVSEITVPKNVEMVTQKTGIAIRKGSRKLAMKGKFIIENGETFIKNPVIELSSVYSPKTLPANTSVVTYTEEEIKRRHLGSTKSCITKTSGVTHINSIFKAIFK